MAKLKDFKEGDTVFLALFQAGSKKISSLCEAKVEKVGRTYVYCVNYRYRFSECGKEYLLDNEWANRIAIFKTQEEVQRYERKIDLRIWPQKLAEDRNAMDDLSLEKLELIKEIATASELPWEVERWYSEDVRGAIKDVTGTEEVPDELVKNVTEAVKKLNLFADKSDRVETLCDAVDYIFNPR